MAGAGRAITVRLLADARNFRNNLRDAGGQAESFGKRLNKAAVAASAGLLAAGAAFGKQAIDMASDLAESQSKTDQVFGKSARSIHEFAETAAESYGQSKAEALSFASAMGSVLVASGKSEKAAANLSLKYTKLASDLASFNNTSVEEAAEALKASLSGEFEQLKKYGIVVNDVALEQEALRLGVKKAGATWSQNQKLMLSQNIIMRATEKAQGDFARTSDGLANQQRILQARMADLQTEIGTKLLPIGLKLAELLSRLLDWYERNRDVVNKVVIVLGSLAATILTVNAAVKVVTASMAAWRAVTMAVVTVTRLLTIAMLSNPIGAIVLAIAGLVAAIVLIEKKTKIFSKAWAAAWNWIKNAASSAADWVMDKLRPILNAMKTIAEWSPVGIAKKASGLVGKLNPFAAGGPVKAGVPIVVGERGPEMFIPQANGRITSNGSGPMAGAGGTTQVVLHVAGNGDVADLIRKIVRVEGAGSLGLAAAR